MLPFQVLVLLAVIIDRSTLAQVRYYTYESVAESSVASAEFYAELCSKRLTPFTSKVGSVAYLRHDPRCFQIISMLRYVPYTCSLPTHCGKILHKVLVDFSWLGIEGVVLCYGQRALSSVVRNVTAKHFYFDYFWVGGVECDPTLVSRNLLLLENENKEFAIAPTACIGSHTSSDYVYKSIQKIDDTVQVVFDVSATPAEACPALNFASLRRSVRNSYFYLTFYDAVFENSLPYPKDNFDCSTLRDGRWVYLNSTTVLTLRSNTEAPGHHMVLGGCTEPIPPPVEKSSEYVVILLMDVHFHSFFEVLGIFCGRFEEFMFGFWFKIFRYLLEAIVHMLNTHPALASFFDFMLCYPIIFLFWRDMVMSLLTVFALSYFRFLIHDILFYAF